MDLTKEEALKLHREMWGDMQKELGDNPDPENRFTFKRNWIEDNGYTNKYGILDYCFLCEYAFNEKVKHRDNGGYDIRCFYCPIDWSELTSPSSINHGFCIYCNKSNYELHEIAPISKILALPERKKEE